MIIIPQQTARRFVLGKQGLWPGRRWKGKTGTAQAIRECEAVQLDPLNIFACSQDIVLHSRVLEYKAEHLYRVAYKERQFFDYGGWLAMYPMSNLPYFRVHMQKRAKCEALNKTSERHCPSEVSPLPASPKSTGRAGLLLKVLLWIWGRCP